MLIFAGFIFDVKCVWFVGPALSLPTRFVGPECLCLCIVPSSHLLRPWQNGLWVQFICYPCCLLVLVLFRSISAMQCMPMVVMRQIVFIISLYMGLDCVCIDMNNTQTKYLTKKRISVSSLPTFHFASPPYPPTSYAVYAFSSHIVHDLDLFVLQTSEMTFIVPAKCLHWFLNPITQPNTKRTWIQYKSAPFRRHSTQFIRHNPTIIERSFCHFSFFPDALATMGQNGEKAQIWVNLIPKAHKDKMYVWHIDKLTWFG